jgi:hypothetical protein
MAKQITITIESNSVFVLRGRSSGRGWCRRCGTEGEQFKVAALGRGSSAGAALQHLIDSDAVRYEYTSDGSALICLNSLLVFMKNQLQSRGHRSGPIETRVEEI